MLDERGKALQQAHILHNLYQSHADGKINLRSDSEARNAIAKFTRFDADLGGMLRQMLTHYVPTPILTETQEYHYADPLKIVTRMNDGALVGVNEITKMVQTDIGEWVSTGEVSRNLGRVDVGMHDIVYASKYKTASIGYTSQELDRISFGRQNNNIGMLVDTVSLKMGAVRRKYQKFLNETFAFGISGQPIYGLHTHPNVTRIKAPYRPGATHTAEENIALFTYAISVMRSLSMNLHAPDIVICPQSVEDELSMQFVGQNAQISTLAYIKANSTVKAFISTPEAEIASRSRGPILHFMYRDTDTQGIVTKAMTQLAMPTYSNGEWVINWDASVSGVHLDRPYKHLILELPE